MARVTRSRKIDIAEDHTALAIQTPLPDTPAKSAPLAEISVSEEANTMSSTMEEVPVAAQVKHLKAAFRDAIGVQKRGRKAKGKGKAQQELEQWQLAEDEQTAVNGENTRESPVPEATRQLLQSREGSLVSLLEKLALRDLIPTSDGLPQREEQKPTPPVPTVRLTRNQLAKKQAGQYTSSSSLSYSSASFQGHPSSINSQREGFDITSMFGGRPASSVRHRRFPLSEHLMNYGTMTDQHLYLEEEALAKSMQDGKVLLEPSLDLPKETPSPTEDGNRHNETQDNKIVQTLAKPTVKTLEEVEKDCGDKEIATPKQADEEDSFVERITCRSPAKPVSRIEDSVEALDQLEEALEALDQAASPARMVSPGKPRKTAQPAASTGTKDKPLEEKVKAVADAVAKASRKTSPPKQQPSKAGYASMRVKSTAPKQAPNLKKATSMTFKPVTAESDKSSKEQPKAQPAVKTTVKRPISLLPPKEPIKSTKPPTRSNFELPGEAVARKLKEQREARLAQRESSEDSFHTARAVSGSKYVKSAKPPTKPAFELPGEALSRRKKEAHEARLKAQEEEERKRREFKAKPLRKSIVPDFVPRDTVASRARQSKIGLENMENGTLSVAKRGSNVGAHRPSFQQLNLANMSAHRAPKEGLSRKPSTTSGPSMSGLHMQRTVSDKEVLVQRQRAREIYNRDARLAEDMEREKQEREAAAKRAREEAAERGRQASREWAEKQRVRKLAEGDKGVSAGYGPGGQMGLKG
jgi:hypothetical protein